MALENDDGGEVISINGNATGAELDEPLTGNEDRGDVVNPELTAENLKALVKDAPADDEEPADAPEGDKKPTGGIPKARFDEVNEARKAAQAALDAANAEIAALKAPKAATQPVVAPVAAEVPDFDEDEKEAAYIEAMLDGDTDKAKAIRKEINAALRAQSVAQFEANRVQKEVATTMQAESTQALTDYPYLDTPDGELALSLIVSAKNASIAKGIPPHLALRQAVAAIAPKFAPEGQTPTRELTDTKPAVDTRSQDALKRGAADSLRQPPSVQAGIGNRAQPARVDVGELDDEQFSNLSTAEKKRLRGD